MQRSGFYFCTLLLTLSLFTVVLHAQQIKLPLNERVEDAQFNKLVMVAPVFAFNKDSVANPLDVSAANASDKVEWRKVVKPSMDPKYRAGFAWIFNGSAPGGFFASHTLIGIENPGWTYFNTLIWTDRNNNLDLTDDGAPDTMTGTHGVVLKLGAGLNAYEVYLQHFPGDQFPLYSSLNDGEMNKVKGSRVFYGTNSSFRERRMNIVAGRWMNGRDSFSFALKDVNCNGKYNDAGIDVAMIADYHGNFDNLQGVTLDDRSMAYLEWNNCAYDLKNVAANGTLVELYRDSAAKLKNSLNVGQKIPRFKYCTATKPQKHRSIRRLKGKYTYVYIWRDGASEFSRDSADLHALGNLQQENFQVLALNFGSSGRYVYQYNKRYHTQIIQGFSSNNINKDLKIKKIPTGILLDHRQRIVAIGITPEQAMQFATSLSSIRDK